MLFLQTILGVLWPHCLQIALMLNLQQNQVHHDLIADQQQKNFSLQETGSDSGSDSRSRRESTNSSSEIRVVQPTFGQIHFHY